MYGMMKPNMVGPGNMPGVRKIHMQSHCTIMSTNRLFQKNNTLTYHRIQTVVRLTKHQVSWVYMNVFKIEYFTKVLFILLCTLVHITHQILYKGSIIKLISDYTLCLVLKSSWRYITLYFQFPGMGGPDNMGPMGGPDGMPPVMNGMSSVIL